MIKAGETCAARFVGEATSYNAAHALLQNNGDVVLLKDTSQSDTPLTSLWIRCAICGNSNALPLDYGNVRWKLISRDPVTVDPSVLHDHGGDPKSKRVCHYYVRNGKFEALKDSTPR